MTEIIRQMREMVASIASTSSSLFVLQISNAALPLVYIPFLLRGIGEANYGRIGLATAISALLGVIVTLGYEIAGPRRLAAVAGHAVKQVQVIASIQLSRLVTSAVVGFLMAFGSVLFVESTQAFVNVSIFVATALGAITPFWALTTMSLNRKVLPTVMVSRFVFLVGVMVTVRGEAGLLAFLLWLIAAQALVAFAANKVIADYLGVPLGSLFAGRPMMPPADARAAFVGSLLVAIGSQVPVLLVGQGSGLAAAGGYFLADKIRGALDAIVVPLRTAAYVISCRQVGNDASASRVALALVVMAPSVVLAVATTAMLAPILGFLGAAPDSVAGECLRVLVWVPVVASLGHALTTQVLFANSHASAWLRATATGVIVGTAVSVLVYESGGAAKVAFGPLAAELVVVVVGGVELARLARALKK